MNDLTTEQIKASIARGFAQAEATNMQINDEGMEYLIAQAKMAHDCITNIQHASYWITEENDFGYMISTCEKATAMLLQQLSKTNGTFTLNAPVKGNNNGTY